MNPDTSTYDATALLVWPPSFNGTKLRIDSYDWSKRCKHPSNRGNSNGDAAENMAWPLLLLTGSFCVMSKQWRWTETSLLNQFTISPEEYIYRTQIIPAAFVVVKIMYDLAIRSFHILKVRTLERCQKVPLDVSVCSVSFSSDAFISVPVTRPLRCINIQPS